VTTTSWETPARPTWKVPSSTRGTSAGIRGTRVWPRASARAYPPPSLPVFGSESPPVARTTRRAIHSPAEVRSRNPSAARSTHRTRWPVRRRAPRRSASPTRAARTVRALFESGKSFPPGSAWSATPRSRKNAAAWVAGNADRTRPTTWRDPPWKSVASTTLLVTLQRPPPLTRILAPSVWAPSKATTVASGRWRAAKMAVARPAAPAPTIATSTVSVTASAGR
jgi:hypothetical protein